jgi:hypothetical protein
MTLKAKRLTAAFGFTSVGIFLGIDFYLKYGINPYAPLRHLVIYVLAVIFGAYLFYCSFKKQRKASK